MFNDAPHNYAGRYLLCNSFSLFPKDQLTQSETMNQSDALQQKFQRDINRCFDSDRNMRKRGLQKLYQDLPWNVMTTAAADEGLENQQKELKNLCFNVLYRPLLQILSDPIEKCREHSIGIFRNILQFCSPVDESLLFDLINGLCSRVNDLPFPEQGEELRLQIVELMQLIFSQSPHSSPDFLLSVGDLVFTTLGKGLQDTFPAAKRCWSEILISLSKKLPSSVLTHHKSLLKGLIPNCTHQHHKVRSVTIKVISFVSSLFSHFFHRQFRQYSPLWRLPLRHLQPPTPIKSTSTSCLRLSFQSSHVELVIDPLDLVLP
jgi:hypothetical protein